MQFLHSEVKENVSDTQAQKRSRRVIHGRSRRAHPHTLVQNKIKRVYLLQGFAANAIWYFDITDRGITGSVSHLPHTHLTI